MEGDNKGKYFIRFISTFISTLIFVKHKYSNNLVKTNKNYFSKV